ncbi:hypothetical protein D9M69_574310 [compost metagenome]
MSISRWTTKRPGLLLMQYTVSARNTLSRRSCVTRMTLNFCASHRSRSVHQSSSRVKASSAPKGSSSSSILGSWMRARQMLARCCMPPDSSQGNFFSMPPRPTLVSRRLARSANSLRRSLNWLRYGSTISSGSSTLSSVVRQGSSEGAWKAMPEILSGPVTGWPSMRIRPMLGIFSPVVSFMKVDLPQPEGPTMAMNSPCFTWRLMSSTAKTFWASSSSL